MGAIYEDIHCLLKEDREFVIVTILEKSGSTPREAGARMVVKEDLSIIGTIGGGIVEAFVIEMAEKVFKDRKMVIKDFCLSNEDASMEGMACGGTLKVLLEYLDPQRKDICTVFEKARELYEQKQDFVIVTDYSEHSDIERLVFIRDNPHKEICETDPPIHKYVQENFRSLKFHTLSMDGRSYVIEPVFNHDTAYIFGAGHVAYNLAKITKFIGFQTVVLDDRPEFANRERFEDSDDVIVLDSFENAFSNIRIDRESYIVIVTRGHMNDKDVMVQALRTDAGYIGMIGSIKKREVIFSQALEEGFTGDELKRIQCPIGLDIGAETPEEIAISIAAELIGFKRGRCKDV